jgi:hypothetical protein
MVANRKTIASRQSKSSARVLVLFSDDDANQAPTSQAHANHRSRDRVDMDTRIAG